MKTRSVSRSVLSVIGAVGLASGLSSCGGGSSDAPPASPSAPGAAVIGSKLKISGTGKLGFDDKSPLASGKVQYRAILGGTNLFQAGKNGCTAGDPHRLAVATTTVDASANGSYSTEIDMSGAISITDPHCTLGDSSPGQFESLRIDVQAIADDTTCTSYCNAQGENAAADCQSTCTTGNRVIQATANFAQAELQKLRDPATNVIRVSQDLVLSHLGPPLSTELGVDLRVNQTALSDSVRITHENFVPTDCAVVEGCVGGTGTRTLLRFDGSIQNLGTKPLEIGDPSQNPEFHFSECHGHYHLGHIMLYELLNSATGQPATINGAGVVGRKQGFCMMDILPITANTPSNGYTCENQGISPGWEDVYSADLDCQWLDVTGLAPGTYTLRVTVNPDDMFPESDLGNNTAETTVKVQ